MPIKRSEFLKPISREHHHGLLLCWKIRAGLKKGIEPERIKLYLNWFWKNYLNQHFEIEEKYIFPVLGSNHDLVKKALAEHRRLKRLFESSTDILKNLSMIEEELDAHIRFEERVLFNEIQLIANEEQLQLIELNHNDVEFIDNEIDVFWK